MSRTVVTSALAAVALVLPAGASGASPDAALRLEARAVADSAQAVRLAESSTARAERAVRHSRFALKRAYRLTLTRGQAAAASFSATAETQGDNLAQVVERSRGGLRTAAANALAATARMEATIVARTTDAIQRTESAETAQGEQAASVGEAHASLTANLVIAASSERLRQETREELDTLTVRAVAAQARLAAAVAELRERTRGKAESDMAAAQASMEEQEDGLLAVLARSGRWEITYDKTVGTDSPVSASASLQAKVTVEQEGVRR